mgnify:CR=1 FL=1
MIVAPNLYGDILSDLASALVGGLGVTPSANIGDKYAVYEPMHGSAPDISGKGIANPTGSILSVALLVRYSLGLTEEGAAIERAVDKVLEQNARTADIVTEGTERVSTVEMGDLIVAAIESGN